MRVRNVIKQRKQLLRVAFVVIFILQREGIREGAG